MKEPYKMGRKIEEEQSTEENMNISPECLPYPRNCIVNIKIEFKDKIKNSGTGFLISSYLVLANAHLFCP